MLGDYVHYVALGEVAEINMGQSPESTYVNDQNEGIPFLQGNAEFGSKNPKHKFCCTKPTKVCSAEDVLISVRAPVGDVNVADKSYCIGRGLAAVRFHKIYHRFGWFFLKHYADNLNK